MTIKAEHDDICWEPVYRDTRKGYHHEHDWWPHYPTTAKCEQAIADLIIEDSSIEPGQIIPAPCFSGPCVVITCDECGEEFGYDWDGMHFDPADPMPVPITDCDWTIEEHREQPDKHYCPNCPGEWCDDCGELHHQGCTCWGCSL